jgi:hypothetical protein
MIVFYSSDAVMEWNYPIRYARPRPNKSLQPTATPVMPPAAQEIMPGVAVAEH